MLSAPHAFCWFAQFTSGSLLWPPWCWLCEPRDQGSDLEVSGCFSAEQAIVQQLRGHTTAVLFRVYSAASAKCNRRPQPIVWRQDCLSCTRTLTSSPSEFRDTVKSLWMGADLHKRKDMLNTFGPGSSFQIECCLTSCDLWRILNHTVHADMHLGREQHEIHENY